jgi:hypothetical protein
VSTSLLQFSYIHVFFIPPTNACIVHFICMPDAAALCSRQDLAVNCSCVILNRICNFRWINYRGFFWNVMPCCVVKMCLFGRKVFPPSPLFPGGGGRVFRGSEFSDMCLSVELPVQWYSGTSQDTCIFSSSTVWTSNLYQYDSFPFCTQYTSL